MVNKQAIIERACEVLRESTNGDIVTLKNVLGADTGVSAPIGIDEEGNIKRHSIPRLPNLLVAGCAGTGKSIFLHALVSSLMLTNTPEEMQFVLIDPKRVEFTIYNGLSHLYNRHVYDDGDVEFLLDDLLDEVVARNDIFSEFAVSNVFEYNEWAKKVGAETLPYIVVVVDEFCDLQSNNVTEKLINLLKNCRSVGIHFILATQQPELCVLQNALKAYFHAKLVFRTATAQDSWALLGKTNAKELRVGEAFFRPLTGKITKLKVPYVSVSDTRKIVEILKEEYE